MINKKDDVNDGHSEVDMSLLLLSTLSNPTLLNEHKTLQNKT